MTPDEIVKMGLYVLDANHHPRQVYSMDEWGEFMQDRSRRVALDEIGDVRISTVFLALDHSFREGPPVLFETMVFGGEHDEEQWRCCTWNEAVAQHAMAVALVKASAVPPTSTD